MEAEDAEARFAEELAQMRARAVGGSLSSSDSDSDSESYDGGADSPRASHAAWASAVRLSQALPGLPCAGDSEDEDDAAADAARRARLSGALTAARDLRAQVGAPEPLPPGEADETAWPSLSPRSSCGGREGDDAAPSAEAVDRRLDDTPPRPATPPAALADDADAAALRAELHEALAEAARVGEAVALSTAERAASRAAADAERLRAERAGRCITRAAREHLQRKRAAVLFAAAVTVQKYARRMLARSHARRIGQRAREEAGAALRLQLSAKARAEAAARAEAEAAAAAARDAAAANEAATAVQAAWRGRDGRRRAAEARVAAEAAAAARAGAEAAAAEAAFVRSSDAATRIQAVWRGVRLRERLVRALAMVRPVTLGPSAPRPVAEAAANAPPSAFLAVQFPRVDASFYAPPPPPTPTPPRAADADAEPADCEEEEQDGGGGSEQDALFDSDDERRRASQPSEGGPASPRLSVATEASIAASSSVANAPRGASLRALDSLKNAWGFASDATAEAFAAAAARTRQLHARAARAARHAADPDARAAAVRRQAVQAGARLSPPKPRAPLTASRKASPGKAVAQRSPERARAGPRAPLPTPTTMLNDSLRNK